MGVVGASRRTISTLAPESPGLPGPGETTRWDGQLLGLVRVDLVVSAHEHLGAELIEQVNKVA
jgi:hypothetical protein